MKKKPVDFDMPEELKIIFAEACDYEGTNPSDLLRKFMEGFVESHRTAIEQHPEIYRLYLKFKQ